MLMVSIPGSCEKLKPMTEIFPSNDNTFVHLTVRAAKVSIPLRGFGEGAVFTYMGRIYEYRGVSSIPGPIVHIRAGGKLLLTLNNDLGEQMYQETMESMYSFHGVNETNVHFHGLHGDPNVDDVFKTASPGQSLKYKLHIPKEHLPGLHWYHTHSHGSSYLLLMGGLFGALIVDDRTNQPLASLPSVVLMIHMYRLGESTICDGKPMQSIDTTIKSNMSSNPSIKNSLGKELELPSDLFLINGQHKPTVEIVKGQSTILRLAFAAGSCYLNISLPKECDFHLSAIDGIPLKATRELKERWLYFTTATRYDVVALCVEKEEELPVVFDNANETIFFIKVVSSVERRQDKARKVTFPLPSHYDEVKYLLTDRPTIRRDISFSQLEIPLPRPYYVIGQGTNCTSLVNSSTCYYEHFNGQKGIRENQYHGFVIPLNAVVEARVYGDPSDPMPHPLHLHVNHFVFVHFTPRKGGQHENASMMDYGVFPGEVRDTIPILDGETVIRWRAASYTGEVVYHCHTLTHEDQGMMTSYYVYKGNMGNNQGEEVDRRKMKNISMENDSDVSIIFYFGKLKRKDAVFLLLAIAFFLAAVIASVIRWFKMSPPELGQWVRRRKDDVATTLHKAVSSNEMERVPLIGSA
ncbi:Multicopper oxidase [Trypanosoma melophagium]|uniref:Multicopper oxidase n=1 Tax=Trypanosoma melophagium TaxID=715481 RepID=UPI00351AAEF0|nr:Multicopper oxidase [Trypanosoma melophagium]